MLAHPHIAQALLSQTQALRAPAHNHADLAAFIESAPPQFTPASVLIGLVAREDGLHVLLTRRSDSLRQHAGQISFPGGRIESTDADPAQAALREAHEEIGLDPGAARVLGYLEPLLTVTGFRVYPVVASIDDGYRAAPDGIEVAELFEAPLAFFLDQGNEGVYEFSLHGKPRRTAEFRWRQFHIWGATASMLINLRRRLLP